jgi:hypothetical protein
MSHAALNANKVYGACSRAIECHKWVIPVSDERNQKIEALGLLADLAFHVATIKGGDSEVFVSAEDFALINGHWPQG